jgi:hypothetical protein
MKNEFYPVLSLIIFYTMFFSRILSHAFELEGFWNKKSKLPIPPMVIIDRILKKYIQNSW